MRALIGEADWTWPSGPWVRANMVSTLDGSAVGADGRSGSINNAADREVFHTLRAGCDAIVVGAGTARAEGYRPAGKPLIVVGSALPEQLEGVPGVQLASGGSGPELRALIDGLRRRGLTRLLCEGGPSLLGDLLRAGLVDELCLTITPDIVAGDGRRIVGGELTGVRLKIAALVEADGTLISRWLVSGRD